MTAWIVLGWMAAAWAAACIATLATIGWAARRRATRQAREHHAEIEPAILGGVDVFAIHCPACASVCTSCHGDRLHLIGATATYTGARAAVLDHQLDTQPEENL